MAEFESRQYDANSKRLFYYYKIGVDDIMPAQVGGINNNQRWRIAADALERVMPTFDGTPAVVKPRAAGNPLELEMFSVGNFLHPIPMPTMTKSGAMVSPSIHEHRQYNETYAIGRTRAYKNAHGQWRFRIEITDPKAKEVMLKGENEHLFPPYISAQVFMLPPHDQDLQNLRNVIGSHVAFVDRPAGGFENMKVLAKCHDNEERCQIKLMNASQTGGKCGFCPADAMTAIVKSGSSHLSKNETSSNKMSFNLTSTGGTSSMLGATTGEKVTRIIKDPNYRRGSEVERPEDQKRPDNGGNNNGEQPPGGEDEETRKLRTELEEVRRERQDRQKAGVSEAEKLKAEMRDEILGLKKEKSRTKIEKFMDKTKHIFKTRKAWEDAIEDMLTKLPYDDNDRLIQRLAELEEIWLNRAEAMMVKTKSASLQTNPDAGMRSVPKFGSSQQVGDSSIADVCIALAEALKRGIN
jgi:hypothetical protein